MTTKHTDPQREAMGALNFKQSYARYDATKKRRENWGESVERVMAMHREHLGELADGLTDELGLIERAYKERRILGSQRSLQFGGQAILDKHPRSYNCTSCYVDDTKRFSQALYLLLCGAGVGYSVQRHHVAQLPNVISAPALSKMPQSTFIIEDTIEGWCDALDALVSAYFGLSDQLPSFSFDLIRPEGAAISSCGGKAPGPYPLRVMLSEAERLLRSRAGQPLRPCDASDLMCIAADCVRAGGVRRSALLCMFSPDDAEMIAYKSVDQWWATHPYRARANISAMIERSDPKATQYFEAIFEKTRAYGEPATIWCESTEVAYNPCVTGDTLVTMADGTTARIDSFVGERREIAIDARFGKGRTGWTTDEGAFITRERAEVFRLTLDSGHSVRLTADHQVMTSEGWVAASNLNERSVVHVEGGGVARFVSLVSEGEETVYDLTQPDTSSFIANGVVVHNCVEIGMVPLLIRDPQGEVVDEYSRDLLDPSRREQWRAKGYTFETAFQFCNLTEVNVAAWTSKREAYEAVELATILGCIQASYTLTDDDYLAGTATKAILEREYLCGVSLTGLGSAQPFARDARFLGALGAYAADTANAYYERCGLKKAPARVTCVKPSGNAAVLLGVSSGVHAEHAPRFLRRMQQPKNSPIVQAFAEANPQAVESSMWSAFGTDYAVSFAIETPAGARLKTNETAEDFLRWVSAVQGGWVKGGTLRPESVEGLTHNVSNTCVVRDYEWDDVKRMLLTHRAQFGGVSCLSASGDYDYPQAPFQRVFEPHEIEETDPHREAKIAAWELWNKLRESYVEIDYDAIIEEDDNTELMGEVACAGGACELTL